jgi:outer membrane protein TolC
VRFPILGDVKGHNELSAARLQVTAAETTLRALETEISNTIDVARQKVEGARSSAGNFQSVVKYSQSLLETALVSLSAGKIESRKVFEIESDLFDAKNAVLEAMVNYKVAQVKLGLITGSILDIRHMEVTQDQLQSSTEKLARNRHWNDEAFQKALRDVHAIYPADKS